MSNLLKWSGSKNSQTKEIISFIPKEIKNYYEPFVGGGSIFLDLLESSDIKNFFISDYNDDLINIYKLIKKDPKYLINEYEKHFNNFNIENNILENRKKYFIKIREKYNKDRNPSDFYWIMRTTTNGMPRYNKKQNFNNSCHFSRPGMNIEKVKKLILKYSKLFNEKNVVFNTSSYLDIKTNDFIYCDPPYENTKGMYFSNFNNIEFIEWLNNQKSKWILSYDGKVNDFEMKHKKPNYKRHKYLKSGNSSFRRVIGNSNDSIVYESIYINF